MKFIRSLRSIILFTNFLIFLFSCKKEIDTYPDFQILHPTEFSQWEAGDTISFEIIYKGKTKVKQARICIVNQHIQPIMPELIIDNRDNKWNFKGEYIISPNFIQSEKYFFRVILTDHNNNQVTRSVQILIFKSFQTLDAVYILMQKNNTQYTLIRSDSFPHFETVLQLASDFSNACMLSNHSKFIFCGKQVGPLSVYDINNNFTIQWQEYPIYNPPHNYFENVEFDGQHIIVGYSDTRVKGYNLFGETRFAFSIPQVQPNIFVRHKYTSTMFDLLIVSGTYIGQPYKFFGIFFYESFTLKQYHTLSWNPLKIYPINNEELLIIGNKDNKGVIYEFHISQNVFTHRLSMASGRFYDACMIKPDICLISHENGLYIYKISNQNISKFTSLEGKGTISFDQINQHIYYATNKSLFKVNHPEGTVAQIASFDNPIVKIFLYYQ